MSTGVADRIRAAIAEHGPIGFEEYMRLALYEPGGFFDRPPVGRDRHFVTAPHVHPFVFAHCLRDAVLEGWLALREPEPLRVVELGAGDGTLADAMRQAFAELPAPRVEYTAVEISEGARDELGARGFRAVAALDAIEPFDGVVVANELLDNLPFLRARGGPETPSEILVGLRGSSLVEIGVPWSRPIAAPPLLAGEESTVPIGAFATLDALAERLRRGYVLLIDHGTPEGPAGPPRAYRDQRRIDDILSDPGSTDITAGVDLAAVADHARALGLQAFEPVTQAAALAALGRDRWDGSMLTVQAELTRAGRGSEAVRVWEARSRASLLVEPSGLGGFWWLTLATDGLGEPGWLTRARARMSAGA